MTRQEFENEFENAYGFTMDIENALEQIKNIVRHNCKMSNESRICKLVYELDDKLVDLKLKLARPESTDEFYECDEE